MIPDTAYIESGPDYIFNKKICGLYPLERLINTLAKAGVKKIYLNLSDADRDFYYKKIRRYIKKLKGIEFPEGEPRRNSSFIKFSAGFFIQLHYFDSFNTYFVRKNKIYIPAQREDQFIIDNKEKVRKAVSLIQKRLIDTTEGYVSKNINKKISVPMSTVIAAARIHPNMLTIINFLIGTFSAYLVYKNTYFNIAMGGFLFNFASIFDGVDGEVARFTFRSSKFGGWLDTVCDHTILVFFVSATAYLFYINSGLFLSITLLIITSIAFIFLLFAVTAFLREFKISQSLKAYETEFLLKLPADDKKVAFILKTRYLGKKEFYSLIYFLAGLTGKIHYTIPVFSAVCVVGSIILFSLNRQYFPYIREKFYGNNPEVTV